MRFSLIAPAEKQVKDYTGKEATLENDVQKLSKAIKEKRQQLKKKPDIESLVKRASGLEKKLKEGQQKMKNIWPWAKKQKKQQNTQEENTPKKNESRGEENTKEERKTKVNSRKKSK